MFYLLLIHYEPYYEYITIDSYSMRLIKQFKKIYKLLNGDKLLTNVSKSSHDKNVLISYITYPFKMHGKNKKTHTNIQESSAIVNCFDELGYNCDVIDSNNLKGVNLSKYDVVFGFGNAFIKAVSSSQTCKTIFYGTGRHPYFCNTNTLARGLEFKNKTGLFLKESLRLVEQDYSSQTILPDFLVLLGNNDVVNTFKRYTNTPSYKLNVSFIKTHDFKEIIESKNFQEAQKHFLFYSGGGMIHKGLDLLIDFFSKQSDLHLHICAPLKDEKGFSDTYSKELSTNKNIHNHDFIEQESSAFEDLVKTCAFVILPSCSEGLPTSVINVVANGGLLPVLTKEASIGIDEHTIIISSPSVESIEESVQKCLLLSSEEIRSRSSIVANIINNEYTLDCYSKNLKKILEKILHGK